MKKKRLLILMYHNVAPVVAGDNCPELTISPKQFARQMRWLVERGYRTIRVSDWLSYCRHGSPLPNKPVMLTFDDGYASIAEYAFPLLQRYGFTAVMFIITKKIGLTTPWDGRALMTISQIKDCAAQNIELGPHSRSHADLTSMSGSELVAEVAGSRADLEAIVEHPANSFAYPFGCYNNEVRNTVQDSFDISFTCNEGLNDLQTDLHLMRRITVHPSNSLIDFQVSARFGYSIISLVTRLRFGLCLRPRIAAARQLFRFLKFIA